MSNRPSSLVQGASAGFPAHFNLQPYTTDIQFTSLAIGIDNIHYDVYLSPRVADFSRKYILESVRQAASFNPTALGDAKPTRPPETVAFRRLLGELLQAGLARAKSAKNLELDLLLRLALIKFFTQEIAAQFSNLLLECKERIRARGEYFERSEEAHVLKSALAEVQANRKNIYRQVGQQIHQVLAELDESVLARTRRALFGDDFRELYELLRNRLVFAEGGKDDYLFLEHYVLLGNFFRDPDRLEVFDALLLELLRDRVLTGDTGQEVGAAWKTHDQLAEMALKTRAEVSRLEEQRDDLERKLQHGDDLLKRLWGRTDPAEVRGALNDVSRRLEHLQRSLEQIDPQLEAAKTKAEFLTEQYQGQLAHYLNQPENARRLFDPQPVEGETPEVRHTRAALLEEWVTRLEQRDLMVHLLASYELRNLYLDFCPPIHLQQLKKALVHREELKRVEDVLKQFPTRRFSIHRIEAACKSLRRHPAEQIRAITLRFTEDLMRLRRDVRNHQRLTALMERTSLVASEKTRELSRVNNTLYEFVLPDEARPTEDRVLCHAVIKADVRGSTKVTQDLLARGMNPASHFSLNLYEPVKRVLDRYGAAKVFIEGDAIILAINETEATRGTHRAVAKACLLGREILAVLNVYNTRAPQNNWPHLELGLGIAFQNSPPTVWSDGDSNIMISRALNLSDRLSSCAKSARRLLSENPTLFNVFLFQTLVEGTAEEEVEEFLIRYNVCGIELNDEGFDKLAEEISLTEIVETLSLPWGRESVTLCVGEVPLGEGYEPIVVRKGVVRQLLSGRKIGGNASHVYYEVCTNPQIVQLAVEKVKAARAAS